VCLAAALETVRLLQEKLVANAQKVGDFLKSELERLMTSQPLITAVRGRGLMIGVQLQTAQIREKVIAECFRHGLLVLGAGATTIRLSPPLIIDEEQARFAAETLSSAISAVA
jgi:4-aminobutyrate aminotransferase-like enzyme